MAGLDVDSLLGQEFGNPGQHSELIVGYDLDCGWIQGSLLSFPAHSYQTGRTELLQVGAV